MFFRFKKDEGIILDEVVAEVINRLNALSLLDCLIKMEIHENVWSSPYANYYLMIDCSFTNFRQLVIYQHHEQHNIFVKWLKSLITDRACVDYELPD